MTTKAASMRKVRKQELPLDSEFWLDGVLYRVVPNTNAKLAVSSEGQAVGRLRKVLKPKPHTSGYLYYSAGRDCNVYAHRAVAMCWLRPSVHRLYVNHKDSNKHNNSVSNLEWVTAQENTLHAIASGTHTNCPSKGQQGFTKSTSK